MSLGYLEFFGIAADCFQVLLGALIILLLVRYRKKMTKPELSALHATEAGPFMQEFLLQSIKHQSEQSFDNIQKMLVTERDNLLRLFEIGDSQWADGNLSVADHGSSLTPFQIDTIDTPEDDNSPADRYQQVLRLAADGMDARRIAKQLAIPLGEVELVLKMAVAPNSVAVSK